MQIWVYHKNNLFPNIFSLKCYFRFYKNESVNVYNLSFKNKTEVFGKCEKCNLDVKKYMPIRHISTEIVSSKVSRNLLYILFWYCSGDKGKENGTSGQHFLKRAEHLLKSYSSLSFWKCLEHELIYSIGYITTKMHVCKPRFSKSLATGYLQD